MTLVAVVAGVGAGLAFAIGSVLQQREARSVQVEHTGALIAALVRRRRWLAGVAVATCAYALQALALAFGPLVLVQPLLVCELPFALALAAWLGHRRLGLRELGAALLVAAGLGGFLTVSSPGQGTDSVPALAWVLLVAGAALVTALLASVAARARGLTRTSVLAAAGAVAFGTMAPLMKNTTRLFADEHAAAVLHWQPWAMAAAALTGFAFSQRAFNSGPLAVSLPLLESLQPVVGVVIGLTAFQEPIATSTPALVGELLAAVTAITGIALLDSSPDVAAAQAAAAVPREPDRVIVLDRPDRAGHDDTGSLAGSSC